MSVATTIVASENDLIYLRELILTRSAIVLEPDKDYLLQSRLEPVAKEAGLTSLEELAHTLRTTLLASGVVNNLKNVEPPFLRKTRPAVWSGVCPVPWPKRVWLILCCPYISSQPKSFRGFRRGGYSHPFVNRHCVNSSSYR